MVSGEWWVVRSGVVRSGVVYRVDLQCGESRWGPTPLTSDFRPARADVHVADAAVGAVRPHPAKHLADILGEQTRGQALGHAVGGRKGL
jgi:hypothetical protein